MSYWEAVFRVSVVSLLLFSIPGIIISTNLLCRGLHKRLAILLLVLSVIAFVLTAAAVVRG